MSEGKYPEGSKLAEFQLMINETGDMVNVNYVTPVENQDVESYLKSGFRFGTDEEVAVELAKVTPVVEEVKE